MKSLLLPRRPDTLNESDALPFGMTHVNDTRCPFADDAVPRGYMNTCCSCSIQEVTEHLLAFRRKSLASVLEHTLGAEQVLAVAKLLRQTADKLEQQYIEPADESVGARESGIVDIISDEFIPFPRPRFDEALRSIRKVADWYQKVGDLGFGVAAWY